MQTKTNPSLKAVYSMDGFFRHANRDKPTPFYLTAIFEQQQQQAFKPQKRLNRKGNRQQNHKKRFKRFLYTTYHS